MIDILFANENELTALAEVEDFEAAVAKIAAQVPTLVVTRGAHGACAIQRGERAEAFAHIAHLHRHAGLGQNGCVGAVHGCTSSSR